MAQLICKDVTLGYDGKPVVHGLNFSVEAGDYPLYSGRKRLR